MSRIEFRSFSARTKPGRSSDCIDLSMNRAGTSPINADLAVNIQAMWESGRSSHISLTDDPTVSDDDGSDLCSLAGTSR